jgi:hypothetical protein
MADDRSAGVRSRRSVENAVADVAQPSGCWVETRLNAVHLTDIGVSFGGAGLQKSSESRERHRSLAVAAQ